jgi:hypothetical protein
MDDSTALKVLQASRRRFRESLPLTLSDGAFLDQDKFVADESTFVLAQCSRRSGKSTGIGKRLFKKANKYPNAIVPYFALTRESAKNIMWPVFNELNDKYRLNANLTEGNLTATLPNKARVVCFGADMKNFIQRIRGIKCPEAAIDEAQGFGGHLQELVDDILTPAISDYADGAIALTGTPGPVPRGYFFDACHGLQGYSTHKWTIFQNPYMPRAQTFLESLIKRKGWDKHNPTYLREWCNEWVLDLDALLLPYSAPVNDFHELPQANWRYILGIDIGLRDSDALAVLAWSESTPNIYLVEEIITPGQDLTSLEHQINSVMSRYEISRIVMDTGGLGAKIAEEFSVRKRIPVQAADKARKFENAALLKDWMRMGKFRARRDSRFAKDCEAVQIDYDRTTADRLVLKSGFHSDIIDAVLYAFKESPAFAFTPSAPKPPPGSSAWAKAEEARMEDAAHDEFDSQGKPWWQK